jgi:hypothetical protein
VSVRGRASLSVPLALALLCGCGGGKPPPKTVDSTDAAFEAAIAAEKERDDAKLGSPAAVEKKVDKGPVAPAPFSWEEIRAATKSGRTYRYKVEVPGKPSKERVLTFTKVDDDGAEIIAGSSAKRLGWPTLQKHAEFPKDRTALREETVKLPGGKFDCMVYEVKGEDGEVSTYFFARNLPGAPVLFYVEQDGKRVRTTTLLQHTPGKDS